MAGLLLVTAPAEEPVTLTEVKAFLRIDSDAEDSLLNDLIVAARRRCETLQSRGYLTQTWDYFLDDFPRTNGWMDLPIYLPLSPIQSVSSVKYTLSSGSPVTVSSADYYVDTSNLRDPRILPNVNKAWPADLLRVMNGVEVRFVVGYGTSATSVPEHIRGAIKQLVGFWYENRDAVTEMPEALNTQLIEASGGFLYA